MNASGRRRFASGRTRLVLMALAALFILSVAWWLASAYVEHEHAAVVVQWRARLTAKADDRQRAIEGWIAHRSEHVGKVFVRPSAPARGQLHVRRDAAVEARCGGRLLNLWQVSGVVWASARRAGAMEWTP